MAKLTLLTAATAANGVPSGATAGVALRKGGTLVPIGEGFTDDQLSGLICMWSTAGSGTMTLSYVRIWGYIASIGVWFPLGSGADADKGKLNGAATFAEVDTDSLRHEEPISDFGHFDRLYAEVGVFGGTATAVSVAIVTRE